MEFLGLNGSKFGAWGLGSRETDADSRLEAYSSCGFGASGAWFHPFGWRTSGFVFTVLEATLNPKTC